MLKHITTTLLLFLLTTPCLNAQKKEISQARSYIKSGKYDDAQRTVNNLLKDSANHHNKRVVQIWYDVLRGKYEQGNKQLYLKKGYDTASLFGYAKEMLAVAERLDSISADGRKSLAEQQDHYRANLFNGGNFYVHKAKWQEAFNYFEAYIDCARQPLFSAYRYDSLDAKMPQAAYWATYCGYKMNDPVLTLRHRQLAMQDSSKTAFVLQYAAEARRWLKDRELYVETLEKGFRLHPTSPYFFPRLTDAYNEAGQYEKALALADSALAVNDSSQLYLLAKSTALLQLKRYEESIIYSDSIIRLNDRFSEAYFNAGTAYVNIAESHNNRKDRKQMKAAYQKARGYMERYRELQPDDKGKWAPVLYRIYLNLNMGKQFDEIDRLL